MYSIKLSHSIAKLSGLTADARGTRLKPPRSNRGTRRHSRAALYLTKLS